MGNKNFLLVFKNSLNPYTEKILNIRIIMLTAKVDVIHFYYLKRLETREKS